MDPPLDAPLRLNIQSRAALSHQEAADELRTFISAHASRELGHNHNIQNDQTHIGAAKGSGLTGAALSKVLASLEDDIRSIK